MCQMVLTDRDEDRESLSTKSWWGAGVSVCGCQFLSHRLTQKEPI